MSRRGRTLFEQRWPDTPDFIEVARVWNCDASAMLLAFVWQGYELLLKNDISHIDWGQVDEELERTITQLLELKIRSKEIMTGYEPFDVQHGPYEYETRQPSPAQPPQYDIAFSLKANPRIMWPLEAKVLRTDGVVAPYIKDLKNEFITCRYAPFSSEGAMLGYLISGEPDNVFRHLEAKIPCQLHTHPTFPNNRHRYSEHLRNVPKGKPYPAHFRCHHLILSMAKNTG